MTQHAGRSVSATERPGRGKHDQTFLFVSSDEQLVENEPCVVSGPSIA